MALHAARRIALQKIYARMFNENDCASVLEGQDDLAAALEDESFVVNALEGTRLREEEDRELIQSLSPQRAFERIPALDRAILSLALYELSLPGARPGVVINEAVELAKRFGDEADSKFINGLLGNFVRNHMA